MPAKPLERNGPLGAACDNLRGGMDASPSRDHALVLVFVESVTGRNAGGLGDDILAPPGGSDAELLALRDIKDFGGGFNRVIGRHVEVNSPQRVFDEADLASAKNFALPKTP